MSAWARAKNVLIFATGGVAGGAAFLYFQKDRESHTRSSKRQVFNSWTTNYTPSKCGQWDKNWDHREPCSAVKPLKKDAEKDPEKQNAHNEKLERAKPKATRHLILIRHGQYYLNGKSDAQRNLTEVGRKQAAFTGERLKSLEIPWTVLVQSTMTRAQETAKIIATHLPEVKVEDDSMIEEGAPVPPEPLVGHWRPEASQFFQDGARIEAAFRQYFHRADLDQENDSYTLMVCHANVIRYFVCRALQFPAEAWLRLSLNHASITWLSILPNGRVILRAFGDSGHMPPPYVTSSNSVK